MNLKNSFYLCMLLSLTIIFTGCTDKDTLIKDIEDIPSEDEPTPPENETKADLFEILNLDYPGLEELKSLHEARKDNAAMEKLLTYYRNRTGITNPNLSSTLSEAEQGYADYAMNGYRFYVNDNYLEDKNKKIP